MLPRGAEKFIKSHASQREIGMIVVDPVYVSIVRHRSA